MVTLPLPDRHTVIDPAYARSLAYTTFVAETDTDVLPLIRGADWLLSSARWHLAGLGWHAYLEDHARLLPVASRGPAEWPASESLTGAESVARAWPDRHTTSPLDWRGVDVAVDPQQVGGTWGGTAEANGLVLPPLRTATRHGRRATTPLTRAATASISQALGAALIGAAALGQITWEPPLHLAELLRVMVGGATTFPLIAFEGTG
ncbi:hypothetical protein [Embleya sp. AB8]|uniref:hypothetical protein n=1 Tax=Embleya sp. AB8 TaxID=3156304 RepID=UPI003C77BD51